MSGPDPHNLERSASKRPAPANPPGVATLTAPAMALAKILEVDTVAGFNVGDTIVIFDSISGNKETNRLVGWGSMMLKTPLQAQYSTGTTIRVVGSVELLQVLLNILFIILL